MPKLILLFLFVLLSACSTFQTPYDYSNYRAHYPRSILVLPPLNNSIDASAPYTHLSTVSFPIAEQGYYVFPVALVDQMMKENGVPVPAEMHQIPLAKLKEVFNPDAVMYIEIVDWGQKFLIFNSQSVIHIRAKLVDVESASVLWQDEQKLVQNSNDSNTGGGLIGMLASAAINHVMAKTISDPMPALSNRANATLYNKGLLKGPYRPVTNTPAQ